jgi:predicted acyl esterase
MDFPDISSLGAAYRYVVKIEQKFKQLNKWEFGSKNTQKLKYGKGGPNSQGKGQRKYFQSKDNQSKPPRKKGNGKLNKDTRKWCEFHKIPWHNTDECFSKQPLLVETKVTRLDADLEFDSKPEKGK